MTPQKAAQLARIAQVAFQADRARMATLESAERRLLSQLDDIRTQEQHARDRSAQTPDAMALSGGDRLWQQWIQTRRTTIQSELAQLTARKADMTAVLRQSFGRKVAAEALASRAAAQAQMDRDRKSAWS